MDILSYILSRKYVDKVIKKLKKETAEQSIDKEVIKDIIKESGVVDNSDKVSYEHLSKMGAKNLLAYPYKENSFVRNGVTWTSDNDGSITVNGQIVDGKTYSYLDLKALKDSLLLEEGQYCLTVASSAERSNAHIEIRIANWNNKQYVMLAHVEVGQKGQIFNISAEMADAIKDTTSPAYLQVIAQTNNINEVFDNLVIHPMLRLASDTDNTWQPYAMTNYELTQNVNSLSYIKDIRIAKGESNNGAIIVNNPNNHAQGVESFAEGHNTQARGQCSHAEGSGTITIGANAHAEGGNTKAAGSNSHAEGNGTVSNGNNSHAEGYLTQANQSHAHAEGASSVASGTISHAQGLNTIAQGRAQTAMGMYNVAQGTQESVTDTDYALIIGNGTDSNNRSNALAVQWDGNVVFQDGSKMKSSKDAYKAMSRLGAKNLLSYPYDQNTTTSNGITYTVQSDGSILINGTSTAYSFFVLKRQEGLLPKGSYIISFNAKDINSAQINLSIGLTNKQTYAYTTKAGINKNNNNVNFTIDDTWDNNYAEVRVSINSNTTVDNIILYPMIRVAEDTDDTWMPYVPTNAKLAQQIKNISVGNVDYNIIQQMITDTITEMIANSQPKEEENTEPSNNNNNTSTDPIIIPELDDTIVARELPEGYTQIPYITTNGSQYVPTYIKENNCSRVEYEVELTDKDNADGGKYIMSSSHLRFPSFATLSDGKTVEFSDLTSWQQYEMNYELGKRYKFDVTLNGDVSLNDVVLYQTNVDNSVLTDKSAIILFGHSGESGKAQYRYGGRFYYCKIYDINNKLIKDYIPCVNSEGVVGLYETVTKKFVTSATTTPLSAE